LYLDNLGIVAATVAVVVGTQNFMTLFLRNLQTCRSCRSSLSFLNSKRFNGN